MKAPIQKITVMFVLLIPMAWSFVSVQAAPAPERRPVVNFEFTGLEAAAGFGSFDPDGCISTSISISAVQQPGAEMGAGPRYAFVTSDILNVCTQQQLSSGFGSVNLAPGQFTIDRALGSASLKVTVPVFDNITGTTVNFDVDLNWIATSLPEESRMVSHSISFDGTEVFSRSKGTSRNATASGTVIGGSVNFAGPTGGLIQSVREGQLTLTR